MARDTNARLLPLCYPIVLRACLGPLAGQRQRPRRRPPACPPSTWLYISSVMAFVECPTLTTLGWILPLSIAGRMRVPQIVHARGRDPGATFSGSCRLGGCCSQTVEPKADEPLSFLLCHRAR
jgi:hypothetical protein